MNHLAHARLAAEPPLLLAGNLAGDFVKGRLDRLPPTPLLAGIRMHRRIDSFTDRHPVWRRSRLRVAPRRVSGIIVDVAYDHFLAKHFDAFSDVSLEIFAARAYRILLDHRPLLPPRLRDLVPRIVAEDWFVSYRWLEGVERTFGRLARRVADLAGATEEIRARYRPLEADFLEFYPQLAAFAVGPARDGPEFPPAPASVRAARSRAPKPG